MKNNNKSVSEYAKLCEKLKDREKKMSTVKTELLNIANGSRDVLLQIKAEASEMQELQINSNDLASISMVIGGLTLFITILYNIFNYIMPYSGDDKYKNIIVLMIVSVIYVLIVPGEILSIKYKNKKNKTKIEWSSYILIAVDELLASNAFKPKPITNPRK